jgi:glucose-1-phosphate thymidylyltransferase
MIPYKGRPLIDYIIEKIPSNSQIAISTNEHFAPAFTEWKKKYARKIEIWVEEARTEEEKLGAVSSINYWIVNKVIEDDLLVIASDNYFEFNLKDFISASDSKHTIMAVHDVADYEKAKQFGVVILNSNNRRVTSIEEKPSEPKSTLVSTAGYVFPKRVLPFFQIYCQGMKRDNLGSFISYLLEVDEVYGYQFNDVWFDVGSEKEIIQSFTNGLK